MRASRVLLLVAALILLSPAAPGEEGGLSIDPPELTIGLFFHGADLRVRVPCPEGERAVFRLLGPERDVGLQVKGKAWGVLWTSVGEVKLHGVPSLMLVQGGPELPPEGVLSKHGLTPSSLRAEILGAEPTPMQALAFDEMLKLFAEQGTWAVRAVSCPGEEGDACTVFRLPPDMPTGVFDLEVTFFEQDRVVGEDHAQLIVRRTGFVDGVIRLAEHHGFWYGMIAILIAVLAGLATGYVFGLRRKRRG